MLRKYLITSLLISISIYSYAQFTKIFNSSDGIQNILLNDNGVIIMPINSPLGGGATRVDTSGNLIWSKNILEPTSFEKIKTRSGLIKNNDDFTLSNQFYENNINKFGISLLDSNGNISWSKYFQLDFSPTQFSEDYHINSFCLDNNYYIIGNYMIHELEQQVISILVLNKDGELLWRKEFNDSNNWDAHINFYALENGLFALVNPNTNTDISNIYLFDREFEFQRGLSFNLTINDIQFKDGKYYLVGESGARRSPKIACLDENWSVLWTRYLTLKFPIFTPQFTEIVFTNKGIVSKTADVFLKSELFSLVSYEGDLLGAWRLPRQFFGAGLPMSSSNNNIIYFAFASSFENNDANSFIAFHDPEFKNFGCYLPETCIEVEDFEALITDIPNPFSPIILNIAIEDTGFITQDVAVESVDFCPDNFTPIAVPLFSSDDTLCVGETVPLYNLQNVNAESVQWDIPGSTLVNSEINEPSFSYNEPGRYTIIQIVEYAGCFSDFAVDVVVTAPEEIVLETEKALCGIDPIILDASQSFSADYLWLIDSSRASSLEVDSSAMYSIEISDRHCTQTFDINVTNFDFDLIEVPLPLDSSICEQQPIVLNPTIHEEATFEWSDDFPSLARNISKTDFYSLTTSLSGCSTVTSINVFSEDCSTQIYVPNAFSPNGDGFNDDFIPLGNFFEVLEFKIFDRWGNQVHNNLTPWKGNFRNDAASLGVYVYTLKIWNTLLGEEEFLKGDVVLIR